MNNEFNVKKYENATVYTLESATGGGTSSGSIASVEMPVGRMQRRASLVTSEANKDKPTQTNPVAKAAQRVAKGSGTHKNPKKVLPRKEKHRKPMAEDHEIQMASSELQSIAKNAVNLLSLVRKYSEQDGLEAWQQSKITKAADYLNSVLQSVSGEQSGMEGDLDERNIGQPREVAHKPVILSADDDGKTITVKVRVPDGTTRTIANSNPAVIQQWLNVKYGLKLPPDIAKKFVGMPMSMAESVEDRTSYQIAKILISKGIKYDPAKEGQLINAIGDVMVNELGMDKKLVRNIIYRDDDFLADTLSELHHMSKDVDEGLGKMRGNPGAYNADVRASQSGMGRGPDHRGLGQELAHETNNYAVAIDGRTWKVFADKSHAQNVARSLQSKGKNATVHPTGENPSEGVEQDAYMESLAGSLAEKLDPHAEPEVWVQDFQKANPNKYHQFKNKTPQKKAQMAIAARYAALEPSKKK